ncbi:MAG: hypothetical protein E7L01_26380 [Paenibacillus macerans]|uniref:hypothetical protein n=1 Tax=Paenibacillus TaxID=44249 RepID=UPI002910ECF8|nr:hypothetical protein [Paenibacillus macerans]MDU7476841.1 hypothetical protein [Paenibacillus macerans]
MTIDWVNWNDILHHAFAGAVLALLFSKNQKAWPYFFIGVTSALLPDVTKVLFKDLFLHSLFVSKRRVALGRQNLVVPYKKSENGIHWSPASQ